MKILSLFAHPDDETLSAGATIAKMVEKGDEVYVAIPATGVYSRRNTQTKEEMDEALTSLRLNCYSALGCLGIKKENVFFGEFLDNEMDKHSLLKLTQWIEKIILEVKPDIILTHHRYCTNIDHQYCHNAVVIATRPSINNHIQVLCGEVPSSTGYLKPTQWDPNFYVNVSAENVKSKIKSMETYVGESRPYPHPRSSEVLEALSKVRGSESGFYYAEAFMIQKMFDV